MDIILYLILIALSGLFVGALGRLLLPGRDPMTLLQTMALGVGASFIAGLIAYYVFDSEGGGGLLLSVACAVVLVFTVRKLRERRAV